jgi:cytochrome c oxidase subunit III
MSAVAATDGRSGEAGESNRETAEFGFWVFLASEVMFFGGLFFAYTYGRISYPEGWAAASHATDVVIGTANTAVLLTSSFLVALAVAAGAAGRRRWVAPLLAATAALGVAFLVLKGIEYRNDWTEGLFPGPSFRLDGATGNAVPPGAPLFYMLYYTMTGVHAVHLTIGIGWITVAALGARRDPDVWCSPSRLAVAGLYWHFVDIVWIVLYPLIYLGGRAT